MSKKTVFLTGSSGNMGWAGFKELYAKKDKYNIVLLNRGSQKNREKFAEYEGDPAVKLVWGDLTKYEDVLKCVEGADYVLHVGGMVSPSADYYPTKTVVTNTTAARNIVNAVKAQPNADDIRVVYIGTVAETGDRNAPIHWARTGDPIKISIYDHYAASKVLAEQIFAESGLKHWVSLRQSGILYPAIIKNMDPIMFHVPLNGVLEWATVEDSGRLLANICDESVPEDFWRRFYNIGSGDEYRITNYEFECYLLKALGVGKVQQLFERNWFITRNFHGQWYLDSDVLDDYLHFRANIPVKDYFADLKAQAPFYMKFAPVAKLVPGIVKMFMKKISNEEIYGTNWWLKNKVQDRITAYWGSMDEYYKIGTWKDYNPDAERPTKERSYLDHGYDESKAVTDITLDDLKKAAEFRGGECLATEDEYVDFYTPIKWKCAHGHEFMMSANLVLKGGHWCPSELPTDCEGKKFTWEYDKEAKLNPFFAQVWYPLHDKNENNVYTEAIFKGFEGFKD